jgi:hypothetical protein
MAHNYYLYNDPTTGQLTWIPWDNNMALEDGMRGPGGRGPGRGDADANPDAQASTADSLDLASVGDNWPLIRFLMDDEVYHDLYVGYVEDTINVAFEPTAMAATYTALHELVAPYVTAEIEGYTTLSSVEAFESSLEELITHVNTRNALAQEYLNAQAVAE